MRPPSAVVCHEWHPSPGQILFPQHLLLPCKHLSLGWLEKSIPCRGEEKEPRVIPEGRNEVGGFHAGLMGSVQVLLPGVWHKAEGTPKKGGLKCGPNAM